MPARILVVDDASFIRDMVKKNLRELLPDATLFDAADGQQAKSLLIREPVDLILSDWEMPGLSGEKLLQWVRSQEALAKVPFVMVTSRGDREFVVQAVKSGVSDYLVKPFTSDELTAKVNKHLKRMGIANQSTAGAKKKQQGVAFGSIAALTGGKAASTKPTTKSKAGAGSAPSKGKAHLRFSAGVLDCLIRDLTLQELVGFVQRGDAVPVLFEATVLDICDTQGKAIARINGYISAVQAAEPRIDTKLIKITVRFVDDDPVKFDSLSKYITTL